MYSADLSHADITHATLETANLVRSTISNADLSDSTISGHTDLSYADISGCKFISSTIRGKITYTNLSCEKSDFNKAKIESRELLEYIRKGGAQNVPD
jgi:uncharacterized protein YjbI with pentapeptide repeats